MTDSEHSNITVYDNALVKSQYDLTLTEHRVIKQLTARLHPILQGKLANNGETIDPLKTYWISAEEFHSLWGVRRADAAYDLKSVAKSLFHRTVELQTEDEWVGIHWVSKAHWDSKGKRLGVQWTPDIAAYLTKQKSRFTQLPLTDMVGFKKSYTMRLYEILVCGYKIENWKPKRKSKTGEMKFKIELAELQRSMNVPKSLMQYRDFKRRVVVPCVAEITKCTQYEVEYGEIKKGRKVVELEFDVRRCETKTRNEFNFGEEVEFEGMVVGGMDEIMGREAG